LQIDLFQKKELFRIFSIFGRDIWAWGANHGGAWGGFAPLKFYWGGWQWTQPPQKKPGFSPPTFRNMRGLTRLIVTIRPSTLFPYN